MRLYWNVYHTAGKNAQKVITHLTQAKPFFVHLQLFCSLRASPILWEGVNPAETRQIDHPRSQGDHSLVKKTNV